MNDPKYMAFREVIHNYDKMRELLQRTADILVAMQGDGSQCLTESEYDRLCAIVTEFEQLY